MPKNAIEIKPSDWAQTVIYLDGAPLSIKDRPHLLPIYDNGYQSILLKTSRQCEKSTTECVKMILAMTAVPSLKVVYGAPSELKTRTFSHFKLSPLLRNSPVIRQRFLTGIDILDNVYEKKLANGSIIMLVNSAGGGTNFRSPSCDFLALDEIQEMESEAFPIAFEMQFHSQYKWRMMAGTPLSLNNKIEEFWTDSSQTEWLIPCNYCGGGDQHYWNNIGVKNISPEGLICARCGKPIYSVDGQWVEFSPTARIRGFRISQPMLSCADFKEIYYDKFLKYPLAKFQNEVLGLSWDNAAVYISEMQLRECCLEVNGGGHHLVEECPKEYRAYPAFAGIDWGANIEGRGYTVLAIGVMERAGRAKLVYIKRLPQIVTGTDEISFLVEKIKEFNVGLVVADWGFSGGRNFLLAEQIGPDKIKQVSYSTGRDFTGQYDAGIEKYKLNHTLMLSDFRTDLVDKHLIQLPDYEEFKPYAKDILVEFMEITSSNNLRFDHPSGTTDDCLFALTYLNIARKVFIGAPLVHLVTNADNEVV